MKQEWTMPDDANQSVRHRRLSGELKRMREELGMGTVEVANRLGWDRTKLNRIERGEWKRLKEGDLRALATLYGVTDAERQDALVSLARHAKEKGWWARYSDVLGPGSYVSLESTATRLRFYSGMLIPGLLQTPSYAKAVIRGSGVTDEQEVRRRLEARLMRQEILEREDRPIIEAVIDESALRKLVGGPLAMHEQLTRLMVLNEQGHVDIRVVPDSVGAHQAMTGQFVLLDFAPDKQPPVAFIDSAHNGLFLEEPEEIESYCSIYNSVRLSALNKEESNRYISILMRVEN